MTRRDKLRRAAARNAAAMLRRDPALTLEAGRRFRDMQAASDPLATRARAALDCHGPTHIPTSYEAGD